MRLFGGLHIRLSDRILALLLALASLVWSAIAILSAPEISQIGEWTYIDYAHQLSEGHLPVQGEPLGAYTLEAWSCRGMEGAVGGTVPPPCGSTRGAYDPADWPLGGENYNTFHPPVYFAFAGLVGKAAGSVGMDFTDGARIASAIIAALGVAWLYYAIRQWDLPKDVAAGGTLLAMSTPLMGEAAGIVHNDAAAMASGAAAVWLAARIFKQRNGGIVAPFAVTAVISLTRTMSVVAILGVGLIAGIIALLRWQQPIRRVALGPALAVGLATAISYIGWTAFQKSLVPEDYVPSVTGISTEPYGPGKTWAVIATFVHRGPWGLVSPSGDWYLHASLDSSLMTAWSWILYALFLAALVAVPLVLYRGSDRSKRVLALAVVTLPLLTSAIVQIRELVSNAAYFRYVPGRYAITAIPVYSAALAAVGAEKNLGRAFLVLGGFSFLVLLTSAFV